MREMLDTKLARFEELEQQMQDPEVLQNSSKMAAVAREHGSLAKLATKYRRYKQLNDEIVGAKNAAPPGMDPIWTESNHLMSHMSSASNQRILADIALRLRGETPLAGEPSEPRKQ